MNHEGEQGTEMTMFLEIAYKLLGSEATSLIRHSTAVEISL